MTPASLKIAISVWSFTPNTGGLQAHAQNLCKHLRERGHLVQAVTRPPPAFPSLMITFFSMNLEMILPWTELQFERFDFHGDGRRCYG